MIAVVIRKVEASSLDKTKFACLWGEQEFTLEIEGEATEMDCLEKLLNIEKEIKKLKH